MIDDRDNVNVEPGDYEDEVLPKLPFNDYKHVPGRTEINLTLGLENSANLRHFESMLSLYYPALDWSFQWYDEGGWGYRASFRKRVLCVVHFYRGYFAVTVGIPLDKIDQLNELQDLTERIRRQFSNFKLSPKVKWITVNIRTKADATAAAAMAKLKLDDLKEKRKK